MFRVVSILCVLPAVVLATLASASPARPPIRDCGDISAQGLSFAAITAVNMTCREARAVARATPSRCTRAGRLRPSCTVRGFNCLVARAGKELFFARCSVARGGNELFRVVRFEYGS